MSRLDRSRPYGEEYGPAGLFGYVQDGVSYRLDGSQREAPTVERPSTVAPPPDTPESVPPPDSDQAPGGVPASAPLDPNVVDGMSYFNLRALAISRGAPKTMTRDGYVKWLRDNNHLGG